MDTKNLTKLKKIVKFAQENNIKLLKIDNLQIEFGPMTKPVSGVAKDIVPSTQSLKPTDDDMLFWSVGGVAIPDDEVNSNN